MPEQAVERDPASISHGALALCREKRLTVGLGEVIGFASVLFASGSTSVPTSVSSSASDPEVSSSPLLPTLIENAGELSGLGSSECGKLEVSGYGVKHRGGRGSGSGESYVEVISNSYGDVGGTRW